MRWLSGKWKYLLVLAATHLHAKHNETVLLLLLPEDPWGSSWRLWFYLLYDKTKDAWSIFEVEPPWSYKILCLGSKVFSLHFNNPQATFLFNIPKSSPLRRNFLFKSKTDFLGDPPNFLSSLMRHLLQLQKFRDGIPNQK